MGAGRVARDGTAIWIRSAESGCFEFHYAEVREVDAGFVVEAFDVELVPEPGYACEQPLLAARHRIELPGPLGDGEILGECVPDDATPEGRICARMHEAA